MLKSATAFILFPLKPLNSRRRCIGMRAWRTIPQIAGCASRSKACSVRNPARWEPAVVDPATADEQADERNGNERTMYHHDSLLPHLAGDDRLPNPTEVLLSEVEEWLRDPRSRFQSLDRSEEVERQPQRRPSRQVRVPSIHEVPPVGLHLAGKLLLVGAERSTETKQEL